MTAAPPSTAIKLFGTEELWAKSCALSAGPLGNASALDLGACAV